MKASRLNLDFAQPKAATPRAARWLVSVGAAVLLGSALPWIAATNRQGTLEQALKQAQIERGTRSAPVKTVRPVDPKEQQRERAIQSITHGLATPWADLFAALEAAPTQAVALMAIEPTVANRSVRLTGEARDAQAMLGYLAALQHDVRLSQVVLVSHQVQAQAPGTPVRFAIQALWADAR
jgi:Tfp pilus assembly protein PilN